MSSVQENELAEAQRIADEYRKDKRAAKRAIRQCSYGSVWDELEETWGWDREEILCQEDYGEGMSPRELKEFRKWLGETDVSCTNEELGLDENGERD